MVRDWQPDAKVLPKAVESDTVTTESTNYEGRRVVISDEVVEKLMKQPNVSGALPTAVVDELTGADSQAAATQVAPAEQAVTQYRRSDCPAGKHRQGPTHASGQQAGGQASAVEPVAAPAPKVALTPAATLNKKPRNHYSIQLMGASNTKAVDKFVAENGLAGKIWVYQTKFRGSPGTWCCRGLRQQQPGQGRHSQAVARLAEGSTLAQVVCAGTKELKQ